ncbi:membrane associated DnaJ chaperone-like protein [Rhizophagus clarus]|uniref:Membrane associated DnaJ chaperone-like protein n=1 Tax=Rhizophagus clarus TaxID=94130 RepID=A0A8H3QK53_9GLOM|nr:membrane associated DnaJ chaperone-like protein [Rhizophagus clarus]
MDKIIFLIAIILLRQTKFLHVSITLLHTVLFIFYYFKLTVYRAGENIPKPGQQKHRIHRRRIYIFVVLTYLIYTIAEVIYSIPPNYYDLLGVSQDFTPKDLKSNLRKLQLAFHPDRNSEQQAESNFILLRKAYDTLNDPIKRFAYDRFGPDISTWSHCKTKRDYILVGRNYSSGFYLGTGLILFILNILGKGQFGRFWRVIVFCSIGCIEASLILNPQSNTFILSYIFKNFIIFERIKIFRQLFITIFIALSQVGPVLFPIENTENLRPGLHDLEILCNIASVEIKNQLRSSFYPFQNDQNAQSELKRKMEKLVVDNYLHQNDHEFVEKYNEVQQRIISNRKKK